MDTQSLGKVIRILDYHTLLISAGKGALKVGDKVKIYEPLDTLSDPDGNTLGTYNHTKEILEVTDVDDRYSVCKKTKTRTIDPLGLSLAPILSSLGRSSTTELVPLNVNASEIDPLPEVPDPKVHIGDLVKKA